MFQYAAARRLALHRNAPLKLDLSEYRTGTDRRPEGLGEFKRPVKLYELCVTTPAATDAEIAVVRDPYSKPTLKGRIVRRVRRATGRNWLWPSSHVREKSHAFNPTLLDLPDNSYLDGYWQTEKYFEDVAETIREELAPRDPGIKLYAKKYIESLKTTDGPIVALHVRRGDLAHAAEQLKSNTAVYSGPLGMTYLRAAIARFDSAARFLVFSDTPKDIEWCKQNLPGGGLASNRLHFSEGHTDIQDMTLMSACDHNIIANSTFSWWAAWMNTTPGRRVIAPAVWCTPGSPVNIPTVDLIPNTWEKI